MPFTAREIEKRNAVLDKAVRDAEKKRQREDADAQADEELLAMLVGEFADINKHHARKIADCAQVLTNQLIHGYTSGKENLTATRLIWSIVMCGGSTSGVDGLRTKQELKLRLKFMTLVARNYRDIGQVFTVKPAPRHTLRMQDKRRNPQVRVFCTAPIPQP